MDDIHAAIAQLTQQLETIRQALTGLDEDGLTLTPHTQAQLGVKFSKARVAVVGAAGLTEKAVKIARGQRPHWQKS
jgi:predicted amino acid dehydrogenase